MVNAASNLARLYLIAGGSYAERESWIATAILSVSSISADAKCGIILEGLPSGSTVLQTNTHLRVERIAPGCFCCIGNLPLKVSLNRLLRQKPAYLFVAMNDGAHISALRAFLSDVSYTSFLTLEKVICL
jgi:hypothetical protein